MSKRDWAIIAAVFVVAVVVQLAIFQIYRLRRLPVGDAIFLAVDVAGYVCILFAVRPRVLTAVALGLGYFFAMFLTVSFLMMAILQDGP